MKMSFDSFQGLEDTKILHIKLAQPSLDISFCTSSSRKCFWLKVKLSSKNSGENPALFMALTTRLDAFLILKVGRAEVENIACAVVTMNPRGYLFRALPQTALQRCSVYQVLFDIVSTLCWELGWGGSWDATSTLRDGFL